MDITAKQSLSLFKIEKYMREKPNINVVEKIEDKTKTRKMLNRAKHRAKIKGIQCE